MATATDLGKGGEIQMQQDKGLIPGEEVEQADPPRG